MDKSMGILKTILSRKDWSLKNIIVGKISCEVKILHMAHGYNRINKCMGMEKTSKNY
jgi:hypothetical protein